MKDSEKIALWRQRYFEAQASAEEFVLATHGQEGLDRWIDENARITGRLLEAQQPDRQVRTQHFMQRMLKQLMLYDSRLTLEEADGEIQLRNFECGILRYRIEAANKGVQLTFKSPCGYCQQLNKAIAREYTGRPDSVTCRTTEAGCSWTAKNE